MFFIPSLKDKSVAGLFLLYLIGNIFLLMNVRGIYWDDWALVSQSSEIIKDIFHQNGLILFGYLHVFLKKIGNGIFVYRVILFFSYFFSGICLFYILQRIKFFDKASAFFIALLFLLSPVNDARIALINSVAILEVAVFYYAWFLLTSYLDSSKKISRRFVILALFFVSFSLQSLLVLYSLVLFYIAYDVYQQNPNDGLKPLIQRFLSCYFDFISLPVFFYTTKNIFFKPYGTFENYNTFNTDYLFTIKLMLESFTTSLYLPVVKALSTAWSYLSITTVVFVIVAYVIRKMNMTLKLNSYISVKWSGKIFKISISLVLLLMGIFLFLLAVFPYCAVGKLPQMGNWNSRNQILVPLGMAFIIYYLILLTAKIHKKIPSIMLVGVVSVFIVQNLDGYYRYYIDWIYQRSLLNQFKQSKIVQENTTFIAKDNLEYSIWVNKGTLSINWLLKNAFKEDNRLIVKNENTLELFKQSSRDPKHYASHWTYQLPVYIEISQNMNYQFTRDKRRRLFFDSIFNPENFEKDVLNLTELKVIAPKS